MKLSKSDKKAGKKKVQVPAPLGSLRLLPKSLRRYARWVRRRRCCMNGAHGGGVTGSADSERITGRREIEALAQV